MKSCLMISLVCGGLAASAADITTLDGQKYTEVRSVTLKHNGLFFVTGSGTDANSATVPYANLPGVIKEFLKKQAGAKPASTRSP